jgi:hypothetical protein
MRNLSGLSREPSGLNDNYSECAEENKLAGKQPVVLTAKTPNSRKDY